VDLQQPDAEYPRGAQIRVALRNSSAAEVRVYAVLDELIEGTWRETPLSPSDQDHPFKVARLSPIAPRAELVLSYPACAALKTIAQGGGGRDVLVPCPREKASPEHPFRVRVFVEQGAKRQEVVSRPDRVLPE